MTHVVLLVNGKSMGIPAERICAMIGSLLAIGSTIDSRSDAIILPGYAGY